MRIYLAGGVTGNLISLWKEAMRIFLAGTFSRPFVIEEATKVYLAGGNIGYNKWAGDYDSVIEQKKPFILESYYYIKDHNEWILKMRPFFRDFLLDSGAFTFMNEAKTGRDFDKYLEDYANFIVEHNIDLFFELDIDSVVGI